MNSLETAMSLLSEGLWPIPITSPDDANSVAPGKAPIGFAWGAKRHTPETIRKTFAANPGAGVGLKLGPTGGVIDIDIDDPGKAGPALARIFGGDWPHTRGWSSARGHHWLFLWDDRLAKFGKAIVKDGPYPGMEIRLGWSAENKQYQSVVPPSIGTDGQPREWNEHEEILPFPDTFLADMERHLLRQRHGTRPTDDARRVLVWDAEQRAIAYLKKCDPAISGQDGHRKAIKAACKVGPGFDLLPEVALRLLRDHYNPMCQPPWSERELAHKVEDSFKLESRRGWFLEEQPERNELEQEPGPDGTVAESPAEHGDDPFRLARIFLKSRSLHGFPVLRYWLQEWHEWDGSCYRVVPEPELRAALVMFVKEEYDRIAMEINKPPAKITGTAIGNIVGSLAALCLLRAGDCPDRPAWLGFDGEDCPDATEAIPAKNGLIHLPALTEGRHGLLPPTPRFFSPNCLTFDFRPDAPRPTAWLDFLDSLWPDDRESRESLQEWFGYLLTPDTRQQKMLVIIGPPRSGKGTIARALSALLGEANVVSPTLSALTNEFRVSPLIGKPLAIISDARLNGRADVPVIVERLLSISGEDSQTIDRKNKEPWSGKLRTRFVLMANELPQLTDASRAVTSRTIILRLTRSFLGTEDRTLQSRIEAELPSLLLWAIAGWVRLRRRGYFLQPSTGETLVKELDELSSPVTSFLSDRCELDPVAETLVQDVYGAWKDWCRENGRDHPGHAAGLGRWLRAAVPDLETVQRKPGGKPTRYFRGVRLAHAAVAY